ncbi:MAG: amidase [Hyphomicrobiaceae bacterium]
MLTAPYDPRTFQALSYHSAISKFTDGSDSPSAYMKRCLATISECEPTVKAFAFLNAESAQQAADESTLRWQSGNPLSKIDGMPVGIKDLLETLDMPTEMNCAALAGNFPKRDNAAVWALRQAGAIPFGKTVTAELGGAHPGPTTHPFDPTRTPGGSSSGSAAAIAAGMMPAAIGSQVGGSIIRPAGFCGNFALKPTQGAINRGERQATSMSTHGVHAGSIEDMWQVAIEIARRAGGDRGFRALAGPDVPPQPRKPERLIVLETEGWDGLDAPTNLAFAALLESIERQGIRLLRRGDHHHIEMLERTIAEATRIAGMITAWENRWTLRNIVNDRGGGLSPRAMAGLERAEAMTPANYEALLLERDQAQLAHATAAGLADAMVTLSCPGPAPLWQGDQPGHPLAARPTGDAVFNYPSSMLFAPVVSIPMLAVSGLPVGLQVIGQPNQDAAMVAFARWLHVNVAPIIG